MAAHMGQPMTKIELTLEALTAEERALLKQLLRDAIGEFISTREYAVMAAVQARTALARKLRRAVDDLEVRDGDAR